MRIRSIKPEILTDEDLWDLAQETGLPVFQAFTGLWMAADREGRFEWRPRKLGAQILPYWDGDFSRVLDALATRHFIVKYASGTRDFGLVRTFKDHQVINNREAPSKLPAPEDCSRENVEESYISTREPRVNDACGTREVHAQAEGKGREGNKEGNGKGSSRVGAREESPHPQTWLRMFRDRYESIRHVQWSGLGKHARDGLDQWVAGQAEREGKPVDEVARKLVDGFFADEWAAEHGYPVGALINNPARFYAPPKPKRTGPAAAAEAHEFTNDDPDEIWKGVANG